MPRRRVSSGAWPESEDDEVPARKTGGKSLAVVKKQKRASAAASAPRGQMTGVEWAVKHQPKTEADLCALVDPKRIAALKSAMVAALQGVGPRLIIIHGPVGCGKSTACRVLIDCMGLESRSWDADNVPPSTSRFDNEVGSLGENGWHHDASVSYSSSLDDFSRFLRESRFPVLSLSSASTTRASSKPAMRGGSVALIESLPALARKDSAFEASNTPVHSLLVDACMHTTGSVGSCVILILSSEDEGGLNPMELQRVVGVEALMYAAQIQFNPLAPGRLAKHLCAIAEKEGMDPEVAKDLVRSGDMRASLNSLQFGVVYPASSSPALNMVHAVGKLLRGKQDDQGKLDFVPEVVAQSCELDAEVMAAFIHENMHVYYGDIDDEWALLDALSEADAVIGKRWDIVSREAPASEDDGRDLVARLSESIVSRAASVLNLHVILPSSIAKGGMHKPKLYAIAKKAKENRDMFQEEAGSGGVERWATERIPFAVLAGKCTPAMREMCKYTGVPRARVYVPSSGPGVLATQQQTGNGFCAEERHEDEDAIEEE